MKYGKEIALLEEQLPEFIGIPKGSKCRKIVSKFNYNLAADNYDGKHFTDTISEEQLDLHDLKALKKYYKGKKKEVRKVLNVIDIMKGEAARATIDKHISILTDHITKMNKIKWLDNHQSIAYMFDDVK